MERHSSGGATRMTTAQLKSLVTQLVHDGIVQENALLAALPASVAEDSRVAPMLYDLLHPSSEPSEPPAAAKPSRVRRKKTSRRTKLPYHQCELSSVHFERYYRAQRIVPEAEWGAFVERMACDLPACFRLRSSHPLARAARAALLRMQQQHTGIVVERVLGAGRYWECEATVRQLKRLPEYRELREWLAAAVAVGVAYRQEAVSLVPPFCLDVQPGQLCLDMCAAPGTKAGAVVDQLVPEGGSSVQEAGGCWANDLDFASAGLLRHQLRGAASSCLAVSYHDASALPSQLNGLFDRIICDVPCTGDGALRKTPDKWSRWRPIFGCHQHGVQLKLLRRGLEMLRTGGKLAYSTCSLNPVENEAVVAAVLGACPPGSLRIVDIQVGGSTPGLVDWLVPIGTLDEWNLCTRSTCSDPDLPDTLFPPRDLEVLGQLSQCKRFLPHSTLDSGGFFVAVIEKLADFPGPPAHKPRKQPQAWCFEPVSTDSIQAQSIQTCFGLSTQDLSNLYWRPQCGRNNIFLANKALDRLVHAVPEFKFVGVGARKIRMKLSADTVPGPCSWEIFPEAARGLRELASRRIIALEQQSTRCLLVEGLLSASSFSAASGAPMEPGCVLLDLNFDLDCTLTVGGELTASGDLQWPGNSSEDQKLRSALMVLLCGI